MRALVDEDLPRSLAPALTAIGIDAIDVRDVGLRGQPDDAIVSRAIVDQRVLVTGDVGIGDIVRLIGASHPGLVIVRLPNELPTSAVNEEILGALKSLGEDDLTGCVAVVEPGRVRLRRPPAR